MKNKRNYLYLLLIVYLFTGLTACNKGDIDPVYRDRMREFVIGISEYAKGIHPGFVVIPQNGIELASSDGEEDGPPSTAYLAAIDGNGQEDLFYGYRSDDKATPLSETEYLVSFLNISKAAGNTILVTDYCYSNDNIVDSYSTNLSHGFVSFAATHRELDNIPSNPSRPSQENSNDIIQLSDARNFLYLINPEAFATKQDFISSLAATNYDLFIIDLFFSEEESLTAADIEALKTKANGGSRLVVAYMSIGEAEDYRYYWQSDWNNNEPEWLDQENPDWEGNFKVQYWNEGWKAIIYGNEASYTKRILDAGFDGVYLDIIEAFEYFE